MFGRKEGEGAGVFISRHHRGTLEIAIGLCDDDSICNLNDALLHALELVAASRRKEEEEEIDKTLDFDLTLSDANRFDEHDVKVCCLQDLHSSVRASCNAAQMTA